MIKTKIEFDCTWPKEKVQKLFGSLVNADGITELGLSMTSMPDEPTATEEPELAEVHTPVSKHIETEPLKPINIPWSAKEEPQEPKSVEPVDPDTFTEIKRIHDADLGQIRHTSKPILTYAETKDGRVTISYNGEAAICTTLDTVRALPDKIPSSMIFDLHAGKRAALRGFKKWLTEIDALGNDTSPKYDTGVDPYAPVLTGGARPDTHTSGKVEGDME